MSKIISNVLAMQPTFYDFFSRTFKPRFIIIICELLRQEHSVRFVLERRKQS